MSDGMILRFGTHAPIEDLANEILREHLSGITKHSDKSDILTPWKEQARKSREVHVPSGSPDAALRRGDYHRAANLTSPHLNSMETARTPKNRGHGPGWDEE
jgi:uncharacterized protein HemY